MDEELKREFLEAYGDNSGPYPIFTGIIRSIVGSKENPKEKVERINKTFEALDAARDEYWSDKHL